MTTTQIPQAGDIADNVTRTFSGFESQWTMFWQMFTHSPTEAFQWLGTHALGIATKVALALLIFWAGKWAIRKLRRLLSRLLGKKVDSSIKIFIDYLVSIFLWIFLAVIIIGVLGWNMTGLVAIFAAAAFAIGMALSGMLSNFAGGILVLLLKPFRVGDFIEAQGYSGTVRRIELFDTTIITPDNKTVIIPNGPLSTGVIDNVMQQSTRMVEWTIGVAYGSSFEMVEKVALAEMKTDKRILADPAPVVVITDLGQSSLSVAVRAWVMSGDFQGVFQDMNRKFYAALPAAGVNFPSTVTNITITK